LIVIFDTLRYPPKPIIGILYTAPGVTGTLKDIYVVVHKPHFIWMA
jgi:hypothetical protein